MSNSLLPYNLSKDESQNYIFTTENGSRYCINVLDQTTRLEYYCRVPVQFWEITLINEKMAKGQFDVRTSETVVDFIIQILQNYPEMVIMLSADDGDGKASARARLFNRWVRVYCPEYIDHIAFEIAGNDETLYGYAFYQTSNSNRGEIRSGLIDYYQSNYF